MGILILAVIALGIIAMIFESTQKSRAEKNSHTKDNYDDYDNYDNYDNNSGNKKSREEPKKQRTYNIGDRVYVIYRGQEGIITGIDKDLYIVSINDGRYVDSYEEADLMKTR